jgi:hypothetical protein
MMCDDAHVGLQANIGRHRFADRFSAARDCGSAVPDRREQSRASEWYMAAAASTFCSLNARANHRLQSSGDGAPICGLHSSSSAGRFSLMAADGKLP